MSVETFTEWACDRCNKVDRRGKPSAPMPLGWRRVVITDLLNDNAETTADVCGPCSNSVQAAMARLPDVAEGP